MVNYLASRNFKRFHWTKDSRYELSPMTHKLLDTLTNEVKVIVFFDPENPVYGLVKGLINEYQLVCPKLDVEYVDYNRLPGRAMRIKEQYRLASAADKDLIIFDCHGKPPQVVYDNELSEYDWSTLFTSPEVKRTAFDGEQRFTWAIISVSDPKQFKAYFLTGHGEHDPASEQDGEGYQQLARLLAEKNIAHDRLSLQTNDVPADCQVLIIAGPRTALTPTELERVEGYLNRGGRAFILFMNTLAGARKTGLENALAGWGVEVGNNLVRDRSQGKDDESPFLIVSTFGAHPITNPLGDRQLGLILPRSVRQMPGASRSADAPKVLELAFTTSVGVALKNVSGNNGTVETNGAIPVMVGVEKGAIAGVNPDRGSTRMVVVGDSFFLGNVNIDSVANLDFANLAVNWLLDRPQLLAIGPKPIHEYKILLTQAQLVSVRWILLAALPGGALLPGILVWLRRRK
jgi:gliding motility-associatede transport system auxiliary component